MKQLLKTCVSLYDLKRNDGITKLFFAKATLFMTSTLTSVGTLHPFLKVEFSF